MDITSARLELQKFNGRLAYSLAVHRDLVVWIHAGHDDVAYEIIER